MKTARIVVSDSRELFRAGVSGLLANHTGLDVVGGTNCPREAARLARMRRADIVCLDVEPDLDAAEEAVLDITQNPTRPARALVLTADDHPDSVRTMISSGASGYVLKSCNERDLLEAISATLSGERYLDSGLGARMVADRDNGVSELTERELEVARLIALGYTNREISSMIYTSVRTVESHRSHIMAKLRLDRRSELVRWALEHGLLRSEQRGGVA